VRRISVALGLALCACSAPPAPEGPEGVWWVGERPAVEALLGQLSALSGTPLGSAAARLARALPADCPRLGAHAPDGDWRDLETAAVCVAPGDALDEALGSAQRDASEPVHLAFGRRGAGADALFGALQVESGNVAIALDWHGAEATGALALLVPGEEAAGPDRLARADRLLHARVRPGDGIDLAALAPRESQADRLFRLRSALFESAVLDGSWELALYVPERPGALPAAALALGVRSRRAAVAAAERFVAELSEAWSVAPSPIALPAGRGSCLLAINVLPELAPCQLATDDALVVAWNPRALERALAATAGQTAGDSAARLELDLARVAASDARAARRLAAEVGVEALVIDWPWRALSASARQRDGALRIDARLLAGEAS